MMWDNSRDWVIFAQHLLVVSSALGWIARFNNQTHLIVYSLINWLGRIFIKGFIVFDKKRNISSLLNLCPMISKPLSFFNDSFGAFLEFQLDFVQLVHSIDCLSCDSFVNVYFFLYINETVHVSSEKLKKNIDLYCYAFDFSKRI